MKKIIGIVGYAGTGKDVMAQMMINSLKEKGLNAKRFSFADILKDELRDVFLKHNIDLVNCSREDKELVRATLVEYGLFLRNKTKGRYLIDIVQKQIEEDDCDVAIITDVRYMQYEKDEFYWLTQEMKGKFVMLMRYWHEYPEERQLDINILEHFEPITAKIIFTSPANPVEKENMDRIKEEIKKVHPSQYINISWCSFAQQSGIKESWEKEIGVYLEKYLL